MDEGSDDAAHDRRDPEGPELACHSQSIIILFAMNN